MCLDIVKWGPSMKGYSHLLDLFTGTQLMKSADNR